MRGMVTVSLCYFMLAASLCNIAGAGVISIIEAAAEVVSAGSSLADVSLNSLMDPSYSVNCGIEVENWTQFPLLNPVVNLNYGVLTTPPSDILPCKVEAMVTRKSSGTATGTSGTVSWLVAGKKRRIVLMWEAPYDFDTYSNWLGVGITAPGQISHAEGNVWFEQMYYGKSSDALGFSRKEYYYESFATIFKDDLIEISGTMSTDHQAVVKITVRPVNNDDLAAPIRALLGL